MPGQEIPILFYSVLAGISTLAGIWLMEKKQQWAVDNSHFVNSFAAGLILALAFFHLIPEAGELGEIPAYYGIFIGFFAFFLLENVFVLHSGAEIHYCLDQDDPSSSKHLEAKGWMAFSGLAFHSLVDGIVIGVGFEVDPIVGFLAAVAVISHEIPEGVTSFALMRMSGMTLNVSRYLAIVVALATPIGAIISLLFIQSLNDSIIGILLGVAAGTFIYVAASDMIPETHKKDNFKNIGVFLIGAVLILLITFLSE
ncbi:MAG: ZIP family metal transporter [Candidatus Hodarchaeales archaeon]|jgi:ZIP family zinc transporter/zinc and cadmium transporter